MGRRFWPLVGAVLLALVGLPQAAPAAPNGDLLPAGGRLLAPSGRQVVWLNLDAPRPTPLASLPVPAYPTDLSAHPGLPPLVAVQQPLDGSGPPGGDLLTLDVPSRSLVPLLRRFDGTESFGAPGWMPDGGSFFYQRDDISAPGVAYAGQSSVRYPSRVEFAPATATSRHVLVEDARMPAVAPDGSRLAFVRSSSAGTALLTQALSDGAQQELVAVTLFADLAYPRFSPDGTRIAFVATGQSTFGRPSPGSLTASFGLLSPAIAHAHGLPWDVWLVNPDGTGLRMLVALGADDPSISWSPDGTQLFVYGGSGSVLVDALTGESQFLNYVAGYGATAWLPESGND